MDRRGALIVVATALVAGLVGYQLAAQGASPEGPGPVLVIGTLGLVAIGFVATRLPAPKRWPRAAIADPQAGWEEFGHELDRSRRHARPMAILRVPRPAGTASPADLPGAQDRAPEATALAFASVLRSVDRAWADGDSVYLLLPETDRRHGEALIARLHATTRLPVPDRVRLAAFPDDGLTSGALIAALGRPAEDAHPIPIRSGRGADIAGAAAPFPDRGPGAAAGERLG